MSWREKKSKNGIEKLKNMSELQIHPDLDEFTEASESIIVKNKASLLVIQVDS